MKKFLVSIVLLLALLALPITSRSAVAKSTGTGSVSGIVLLAGHPVAGVEIFLGIFGDDSQGIPFEARFTCSDKKGRFSFSGVPLNRELISATGPSGHSCANPLFLDTSQNPGHPLLIQYWNHHDGILEFDVFTLTSANPKTFLQYDLNRWPTEGFPVLTNDIRSALAFFHQGQIQQAVQEVNHFIDHVNKKVAQGQMDSSLADLLIAYAENLRDTVFLFTGQ